MWLWVVAYTQAEYWYTSTNNGYIMTCKDYSIAKDDDIAAQVDMRRRYRRKKEKEAEENHILEKTKFILKGEGRI